MGAVTYVVRMIAKQGQAEAVQELLLTNPRRIEQGEQGNLARIEIAGSPFLTPDATAVAFRPYVEAGERYADWSGSGWPGRVALAHRSA